MVKDVTKAKSSSFSISVFIWEAITRVQENSLVKGMKSEEEWQGSELSGVHTRKVYICRTRYPSSAEAMKVSENEKRRREMKDRTSKWNSVGYPRSKCYSSLGRPELSIWFLLSNNTWISEYRCIRLYRNFYFKRWSREAQRVMLMLRNIWYVQSYTWIQRRDSNKSPVKPEFQRKWTYTKVQKKKERER